jgi:hypothetical protein
LTCWNNQLTSLNVQGLTNLQWLTCWNNQLTSLNVQGCTELQTLSCGFNQLTTLDVSKNTALTELYCYNNQLTFLDVSKNIDLTNLDCRYNQLTFLDVSKNIDLTNLNCANNQLTSLNLKNNSILAIYSLDSSFSKNPNLKYICVDDEVELEQITKYCKENNINAEVNTYCSFAPTGEKNTITGKLTSCDAQNIIFKNTKLKINDGTTTGYSITNDTANYTFYTQTGNFTLTPILENPYYHSFSCNRKFCRCK